MSFCDFWSGCTGSTDEPGSGADEFSIYLGPRARYSAATPILEITREMLSASPGAEEMLLIDLNYNKQSHYEEAEPLYRRALEIHRKALGEEHPDTVQTRENLENIREAMAEKREQEELEDGTGADEARRLTACRWRGLSCPARSSAISAEKQTVGAKQDETERPSCRLPDPWNGDKTNLLRMRCLLP